MTTTSDATADVGASSLGHLQAIHQLTAATVAATTVESIHEAAIDVLITSLPVDRAAILLFDADGVLGFRAWRGLSDGYRRQVEGHSPWGPDDTAPDPIVIGDVGADGSLGALRDVVLAEGIRSIAFIPLLYGSRLLGKFMLYCDRPHHFDSSEVALARTVAGHIAFALEKRRLEDELRLSADKLGATLNAVTEGITVQAPDGALLMANEAGARMLGFPSVESLLAVSPQQAAARFELLDEEGGPLPVERLPGRAALRGEEPPEMLVRWRVAGGDDERWSLVRSRPVRNDAGQVRFAVNVFRDVTDRQMAVEALRTSEARLAFLASASRRLLTTSLEPRRVLDEVADLAVPELADWCVVREFKPDGGLVSVGRGRRQPEDDELLARLESYGDVLRERPGTRGLSAGRSILVRRVTDAMLEEAACDEGHLELLRRLGLRSVIIVPLKTRGLLIGLLILARGCDRPAYTDADLALAEELAGQVAATVDNARSYADEHATAETLARALLPGRLPDIPGLQLAARYRAAGDVGGDFYDCFPTTDGTWLLVVGDVCGRGIHAASMTGLTRHTIRAAALHARSPAPVLDDLNRLLLDAVGEEMPAWLSPEQGAWQSFCTVCLAAVTPSAGGATVVVSSAGHPLPYLVRRSGAAAEVGRPGSLLGVLPTLEVFEDACELGPGDALVLFTDGITERRRAGALFEEHLQATLTALAGAPADELAREVEAAAVAFGTGAPGDDMAVLAIGVPSEPAVADDASGPLRAGPVAS